MSEITVTIHHAAGLHARPLAKFVKVVKSYDAAIEVSNLTRGKGPVNGASPVKLLLLAALQGHELKIAAAGPQAEEALNALKALVENNFEDNG
jgi:phosphocarrier protein FPr